MALEFESDFFDIRSLILDNYGIRISKCCFYCRKLRIRQNLSHIPPPIGNHFYLVKDIFSVNLMHALSSYNISN